MFLSSKERDPVLVADWAELQILYSGGTGIALEAVRTDVETEGLLAEQDYPDVPMLPNELSERLVSESVREIQRRAQTAGQGYPFRVSMGRLELRRGVRRWNPYTFCLLVADRDYYVSGDLSARMFEHLASRALASYLRGSSVRFGEPRDTLPDNINQALDELTRLTGDSRIAGIYPVKLTDQDFGLDVVAWKDFPDRETSKVLVYMQCATGENWEGKRGDLDLSAGGTWNQIISWTIPPVKALAIPYVVPPGDRWRRATPGLLLLERVRIASVLPARLASLDGVDWVTWCKQRVEHVSHATPGGQL
jgi:hypothetical protein